MGSRSEQRNILWDNFKGILIFLVVLGHFMYESRFFPASATLYRMIYTFHMEAFVFISGYFSKSSHAKGKDSLIRLGTAYLIFNTLMILYSLSTGEQVIQATYPYYSMWYLPALIVWRLILRFCKPDKGLLIASVFIGIASGLFGDIDNTFAFSRILCFFPFFVAGAMFREEDLLRFRPKEKHRPLIGWLLLLFTAAATWFFVQQYRPDDNSLMMFAYQLPMDILIRLLLYPLSALWILSLLLTVPARKRPLLTAAGKNSLSVYLLHRIPVLLLYNNVFSLVTGDEKLLLLSLTCAVLITVLSGNDLIGKMVNRLLSYFMQGLRSDRKKHSPLPVILSAAMVLTLLTVQVLGLIKPLLQQNPTEPSAPAADSPDVGEEAPLLSTLSPQEAEKLDNCTRLLFCGDLILLEDQVKRAEQNGSYQFDPLFKDTASYIAQADYAIGVFEGPMAGEAAGYSSSNYDDGKPLALNYPDEFAKAVKDAGFDLVTTANNHLLDKELSGALRTLDILDQVGLEHTGSYRNQKEKDSLKLIHVNGIRIAVLSYTYGSNFYTEDMMLSESLSFVTSLTADPKGQNFQTVKEQIRKDFEKAKAASPDLILVLPHMGEQFLDAPDDYQNTWYELFFEYGADIILNDHTHSVQPVELRKYHDKTCVLVSCPGNYANIYREYNGDASAMVEIYLQNDTKSPCAAAVIPMWTMSEVSGNYHPVPIYDLMNTPSLLSTVTTYDLERAQQVQSHITRTMLGLYTDLSLVRQRYYLTEDGVFLPPCTPLSADEALQGSVLYQKIRKADSVCYVGDSITEGTKNGGFGWYRPIEQLNPHTVNVSKGGATTKTILDQPETNCGLYVVAIGTNDVRYRDDSICAMTPEEYITELEHFTKRITAGNPAAEFCFIAPWMALDFDTVSVLDAEERDKMLAEYSASLKNWCQKNHYLYSDPNARLKEFLNRQITKEYMMDFIHPNSLKGIQLYCSAVLDCSCAF